MSVCLCVAVFHSACRVGRGPTSGRRRRRRQRRSKGGPRVHQDSWRDICFTLNSLTRVKEELMASLQAHPSFRYCVIGLERGECGTPPLPGVPRTHVLDQGNSEEQVATGVPQRSTRRLGQRRRSLLSEGHSERRGLEEGEVVGADFRRGGGLHPGWYAFHGVGSAKRSSRCC